MALLRQTSVSHFPELRYNSDIKVDMFISNTSESSQKPFALALSDEAIAAQQLQAIVEVDGRTPTLASNSSILLAQTSSELPASGESKDFVPGFVWGVVITSALLGLVAFCAVAYANGWRVLLFKRKPNIPLGNYSIDVEAIDNEAVRTKDHFRVDVQAVVSVNLKTIGVNRDTVIDTFFSGDDFLIERLEEIVRRGAVAAIAEEVSELDMESLGATKTLQAVLKDSSSFKDYLDGFGLELKSILISEISENNIYDPDNFFDAKALSGRAQKLATVLESRRKYELGSEATIDKLELDAREKQLKTTKEFEKKKLEFDLDLEKEHLENQKAIEAKRIEQEREIEIARLKSNSTLAEERLEIEKKLVETDIKRLTEEEKRVKAEDALNAEIARLKGERLENQSKREISIEVTKIEALAEVEKLRLQKEAEGKIVLAGALNQFNGRSQLYQLILELTPMLLERMPELGEVLTPQPGVLGDTHIYSMSGDNGGGLNKLLLSAGGLSLIGALLEDNRFMKIVADALEKPAAPSSSSLIETSSATIKETSNLRTGEETEKEKTTESKTSMQRIIPERPSEGSTPDNQTGNGGTEADKKEKDEKDPPD